MENAVAIVHGKHMVKMLKVVAKPLMGAKFFCYRIHF